MALLKLGPAISSISGSIGGTTFARNKSGAYARQRTKPVNPNSVRQVAVRAIMSACRTIWFGTLTAAQRAAWALYANNVPMINRLGDTVNLSGYNMFTRSNAAKINAGLAAETDAPTTFSLPEQDTNLAASGVTGTQKISVSFDNTLDWAKEAGGQMLIYAGAPQDTTRNFFNGPWRYAGKIAGASPTAPTSPALIDTPFPIATGNKLWVKARILRADGRLSSFFRCEGVVAAS